MRDIVAEAIAFYNETAKEWDLDLATPATWDYVLGPVPSDQVERVTALLHEQGFTRIESQAPDEAQPALEIHAWEEKAHTAETLAQRIEGLAALAEQNGFELLNWGVDAPAKSASLPPAPARRVPRDRLVEVYAAANPMEAQWLCEVLEDADIEARMVGDFLATGAVSLGTPTAPKIWVHDKDADRAREIIEEWASQPQPEKDEADEGEDEAEAALEEAREEAEVERSEPPLPARPSWSGQAFIALSLCLVLAGIAWACYNWIQFQTYSATTEGVLSHGRAFSEHVYDPPRDPLAPGPNRTGYERYFYGLTYRYVVDGKRFYVDVNNSPNHPKHVPIYYNPDHPQDCIVGSLTPPWLILLLAFAAGGFMLFVGYQWSREPASETSQTEPLPES